MEQLIPSNLHELFPEPVEVDNAAELVRLAQERFQAGMAELRARHLYEGEDLLLESTRLHNQARFLIEHSITPAQTRHIAA